MLDTKYAERHASLVNDLQSFIRRCNADERPWCTECLTPAHEFVCRWYARRSLRLDFDEILATYHTHDIQSTWFYDCTAFDESRAHGLTTNSRISYMLVMTSKARRAPAAMLREYVRLGSRSYSRTSVNLLFESNAEHVKLALTQSTTIDHIELSAIRQEVHFLGETTTDRLYMLLKRAEFLTCK